MTLTQAKNLEKGQIIYHRSMVNADGTPQRWKVTSVKRWKTRPDEVLIRLKRGLKEYGAISNLPGYEYGILEEFNI